MDARPQDARAGRALWQRVRDFAPARHSAARQDHLPTTLTPARIRATGLAGYALATSELLAARDIKSARVEIHRRLTVPWAHLLVVLWGVPLMVRWGTRNPVIGAALALAAGIVFYGTSIAASGLAEETSLPAGLCLWLPTALFAAAGLWLYARLD